MALTAIADFLQVILKKTVFIAKCPRVLKPGPRLASYLKPV